MKIKKTYRGFARADFTDRYGEECSIQDSSLATEAAIWLGINDPTPQILAKYCQEGAVGWSKVPMHPDVNINGRMHLTQDQVKELLPILIRFAETGTIELP